jgi:hypothetical protein
MTVEGRRPTPAPSEQAGRQRAQDNMEAMGTDYLRVLSMPGRIGRRIRQAVLRRTPLGKSQEAPRAK